MNKIGKRGFLIACLFLLVLGISGCGFKDIDKRFFVVALGIDASEKEKNHYLVSLKLAIPSADLSTGENKFIIISEEAKTITEAIRMLKTKVDKELDFSHAKVVIFGEEVVKNELPPHLVYWLLRRRDIQQIAYMSIGNPTALDVLKVKPMSERLPSNALFIAFGKSGTETPYIMAAPLFDFLQRYRERGLDPYLPIIKAKKDLLEINTIALMDKKKVILTLSSEESKLFNLLYDNINSFELKANKDDYYFLLFGEKVNTKYSIQTQVNRTPFIELHFDVTGIMEEALFSVTEKDIPIYERIAEKDFKEKIEEFLHKLQEANVDPLGFGLRYRARHFNNDTEWKTWQSIYPEIEFKVIVNVNIEGVGIVR